jgi:hypothetical protein
MNRPTDLKCTLLRDSFVTMSVGASPASTIHVSTDGSKPTCSSPEYTGQLNFEETQVGGRREVSVEAITCQEGYAPSHVASVNYVIEGPQR